MSIKFIESSDGYSKYLQFDGVCFIYHLDSDEFEVRFISPDLHCSADFKVDFFPSELLCRKNVVIHSGVSYYGVSSDKFAYIFPNNEMLTQFLRFTGLVLSGFSTISISENDKVPF
ncbi:hypothetical protein [Aliivibrio sifiae]|uniref:hypothetical protein n=1 Tax=Aliivibrio sifiae TaxID=566293 RepID=UPI003D1232E9